MDERRFTLPPCRAITQLLSCFKSRQSELIVASNFRGDSPKASTRGDSIKPSGHGQSRVLSGHGDSLKPSGHGDSLVLSGRGDSLVLSMQQFVSFLENP